MYCNYYFGISILILRHNEKIENRFKSKTPVWIMHFKIRITYGDTSRSDSTVNNEYLFNTCCTKQTTKVSIHDTIGASGSKVLTFFTRTCIKVNWSLVLSLPFVGPLVRSGPQVWRTVPVRVANVSLQIPSSVGQWQSNFFYRELNKKKFLRPRI